MPFGGGASVGGGENYNHYGAIRLRVNGSGHLNPSLLGLDGVVSFTCAVVALATTPAVEPLLLSNLITQRARVQLQTTSINDFVKVQRIVVFIKPQWSGGVV